MAQTPEGSRKSLAKRWGITIDELKEKIASGLKRCTTCKEWKPASLYGRDSTRHDGLDAHCFGCRRVKVRVNTKGRASAFKGHTHTLETKAKMSESAKKRPSNRIGKKHTPECRARIARIVRERAPRGESHYAYSHGKHQRDKSERRTVEYKNWRDDVYRRDNYTCQQCGDAKGGNLQARHVKSFAKYPELRFDVSNGITYCQDCHEKLHLKPIPTPANIRRRKKHKS